MGGQASVEPFFQVFSVVSPDYHSMAMEFFLNGDAPSLVAEYFHALTLHLATVLRPMRKKDTRKVNFTAGDLFLISQGFFSRPRFSPLY